MSGRTAGMAMNALLHEGLSAIGDVSGVSEVVSVSGGDINQAYRVTTSKRHYFVKYNDHAPKGFFQEEVLGLHAIGDTGAVAVPEVYFVGESEVTTEGILILEWIHQNRVASIDERLGHAVAALHQSTAGHFGFDHDNFIGWVPQPNRWYESWVDYFRECRLLPQIRAGIQAGRLTETRQKRLWRILDRLDEWIPEDVSPSLLHGDLWSGNWLPGSDGNPVLIDPAVFYGHFEFELAYTELFGGFSDRFYRSYEEVRPLSSTYGERRPLYQLFYLLAYLNMFGETYSSATDEILKRYGGPSDD